MYSSRREYWRAFHGLQHLAERMLRLFPPVGLLPTHPGFWQFWLDPEFHLYRSVLIIMDGSAMLEGFLAEFGSDLPGPEDWEIAEGDNLVGEALEIQRALQAVPLPDDFYEVVEAYRRVSLELSAH
jgi:hypothetical protein